MLTIPNIQFILWPDIETICQLYVWLSQCQVSRETFHFIFARYGFADGIFFHFSAIRFFVFCFEFQIFCVSFTYMFYCNFSIELEN